MLGSHMYSSTTSEGARASSKMADVTALKKLKIAELRKELTDRGLDSKGTKAELLERLTDILETAGVEAALESEVDVDAEAVLATEDDAEEDLLNPEVDLDDGDVEDEADVVRKVELGIEEELEEEVDEKAEIAETVEVKKAVMPPAKSTSDAEKKALRAQKFGVTSPLSDADRKKARAERFGMPAPGSQNKSSAAPAKGMTMAVDANKLKQRAERFGTSVSPTAVKNEEAERIRKRKERFGAITAAANSKTKVTASDDVEAKKLKRAERFGMA